MTISSLYYRSGLRGIDLEIYDNVLKGLNNRSHIISVPQLYRGTSISDRKMNYEKINEICDRVLHDSPLFFDCTEFSFAVFGRGVAIKPKYMLSDDEYDEVSNSCITKMLNVLPSLVETDNYDTFLNIHDYLTDNIRYSNDRDRWDHTITNPMLRGKGVCDGISKCYKMMCNLANLESGIISGEARNNRGRGPHAWNVVKYNNDWYNVDVTFDLIKKRADRNRDYFFASDHDISKDHFFSTSYPGCTDETQYYHRKVGVVVHNPEEFQTIIKLIRRQASASLSVKIDGSWYPKISELQSLFRQLFMPAIYELSYNEAMRVCTICKKGLFI